MRRGLGWVLVGLVCLACLGQAAPARAQSEPQKGIAYTAWWPGEYSSPAADLSLADLKATGANWISLLTTQYQANIDSTTIAPNESTPTDADMIHTIQDAHKLGLKVMLKPHVDLSNDPQHWRGEIGLNFSANQWTAWFGSYQTFINHYADLAQANGVEQFCAGTELVEAQKHAAAWRTVVAGLRSRFSGPLTYASNWGDEVGMTWWDALDFIGVDAYYRLSPLDKPTLTDLKAAWAPHVIELANLAAHWHKTILFTEVGYRSVDRGADWPGDWQLSGPVNLQLQADAYQAVFESTYAQPWLAGLYWWAWSTDPYEGGRCDNGYSPHDKPAEAVVRQWYGATAPLPVRLQPDPYHTLTIYSDALAAGWEDWSWNATVNLVSTYPVYKGKHAILFKASGNYGGLSLYHPAINPSGYAFLEFYIRSTTAGADLVVNAQDNNDQETGARWINDCRLIDGGKISSTTWKRVLIPLAALNPGGGFITRFSFMNPQSQSAAFSIDEIRLVGGRPPPSLFAPLVSSNLLSFLAQPFSGSGNSIP